MNASPVCIQEKPVLIAKADTFQSKKDQFISQVERALAASKELIDFIIDQELKEQAKDNYRKLQNIPKRKITSSNLSSIKTEAKNIYTQIFKLAIKSLKNSVEKAKFFSRDFIDNKIIDESLNIQAKSEFEGFAEIEKKISKIKSIEDFKNLRIDAKGFYTKIYNLYQVQLATSSKGKYINTLSGKYNIKIEEIGEQFTQEELKNILSVFELLPEADVRQIKILRRVGKLYANGCEECPSFGRYNSEDKSLSLSQFIYTEPLKDPLDISVTARLRKVVAHEVGHAAIDRRLEEVAEKYKSIKEYKDYSITEKRKNISELLSNTIMGIWAKINGWDINWEKRPNDSEELRLLFLHTKIYIDELKNAKGIVLARYLLIRSRGWTYKNKGFLTKLADFKPEEDLVEHYMFYALYKDEFKKRAQQNKIIQQKYNFIQKELF